MEKQALVRGDIVHISSEGDIGTYMGLAYKHRAKLLAFVLPFDRSPSTQLASHFIWELTKVTPEDEGRVRVVQRVWRRYQKARAAKSDASASRWSRRKSAP